jgi:hypothetical protein
MHTKTRIALATMLVACISSNAMAESGAAKAGTSLAASSDAANASLLTPVAWHKSPRSTHLRLRRSRNAGLRTGGYGLLGSQVGDDNYKYWRQACCQ